MTPIQVAMLDLIRIGYEVRLQIMWDELQDLEDNMYYDLEVPVGLLKRA